MARPSRSNRGNPHEDTSENPLEEVFEETVEFLERSRHEDLTDIELWEDLLGCESDQQVFDETVEFVDRGKYDESDLCEELLYG